MSLVGGGWALKFQMLQPAPGALSLPVYCKTLCYLGYLSASYLSACHRATPGNINGQASFSLIQNSSGYFNVPHINNLHVYNNLYYPTGPELYSFLTL